MSIVKSADIYNKYKQIVSVLRNELPGRNTLPSPWAEQIIRGRSRLSAGGANYPRRSKLPPAEQTSPRRSKLPPGGANYPRRSKLPPGGAICFFTLEDFLVGIDNLIC